MGGFGGRHPRVPGVRPHAAIRSGVLLALLATGAACGAQTNAPAEPKPAPAAAPTLVAALGDSIVAGSPLWDPDPAVRSSLGGSLDPESQFELWAEARAGGTLRIRNCGVFGERTDEITARLERCAGGTRVLVVQGGINDIAQMRPVLAAAADLRATVRAGREQGLRVLLAEVLPWNNGPPGSAGPIRRLNREIARVAREQGAELLPFYATLEDPRG